MKKIASLLITILVSLGIHAANISLPLTSVTTQWGSATYNTSTSTITFTGSWNEGVGWWLNANYSQYDNVYIEFAQALPIEVLLTISYGDNDYEQFTANVGATSVSATLNASMKSSVKQIYFQSGSAGSVVLKSATVSGQGGSTQPTDPATTLGGFHVSGTELLDGYNQPFRMLGANLAYAWYKAYGYTKPMQAMRRAGANAVRVALSDGATYTKDQSSTLQGMISLAESLEMVLVLEVHDHTGSADASALETAANYWVEMKDVLKGHEHSVIINIANEWMGTWNRYSAYETGYTSAISIIRNAGLTHCLMVDAAGWGQEVASITTKAQSILNADPQKNVIFSVHMYEVAGASGKVQTNIDNVFNHGVALCIGEFAWAHNGTDVDEDAIISYCQTKSVGWLAWSWWGNGSGLGYIDLVTDPYNENSYTTQTVGSLSCNWGQKVMNAWSSQASTCTVFVGPPESTALPQTPTPTQDDTWYDLLGRPVATPQAGQIYIHAGRKIIIR